MNTSAPLAFPVAVSLSVALSLALSGCASDPDAPQGRNDLVSFGNADPHAGARPASLTPMTVAELSECARRVVAMKAEEAALRREGQRIAYGKAALYKRGEEMEQRRAGLDAGEVREVKEFNDAILQHQIETRSMNVDVVGFNQRSATATAEVDRFNISCAQRVYRPSDLDALPPALVEAMKAASMPSDPPPSPADNAAR